MQNQENNRFDLLLKGGKVIDPANGILAEMDVGMTDGKIAAVGTDLPCSSAKKTVDVGGCHVTPGLIDMHCHIYPKFPLPEDGLPTINGEAHMFQSGVTTAVDAGTCGSRDFLHFKEEVIDRSLLRILSFVNIASGGMVDLFTEQELSEFHPKIAAALAQTFPDIVVGIKTAHYWVGKPFDEQHPAWASVDSALEAASLCGKPVMADFQPTLPGRSYPDLILRKLRPGDIHTHVYAQQFPILDQDKKVNDFMFQARERGIIFDLGHGAASFWFRNAIPAWRQGFWPDTISTDLYHDNVAGPVINLLHVMSKYLSMGMPLQEVIFRTTQRPAQVLRHPELGNLSVGACADVAVLQVTKGEFGYADGGHARMKGTQRLECLLTVRAGRVVFDPYAKSMPEWETAPAPYWVAPGVL